MQDFVGSAVNLWSPLWYSGLESYQQNSASLFVASHPQTHTYLESTGKGSPPKAWKGPLDASNVCLQVWHSTRKYYRWVVHSCYPYTNQRQKLVKASFQILPTKLPSEQAHGEASQNNSRAWRQTSCPRECCSVNRYQHRPQTRSSHLNQDSPCHQVKGCYLRRDPTASAKSPVKMTLYCHRER